MSPFVLLSLRFALAGCMLALFRPAVVPQGLLLIRAAGPLSLSLFSGFCLQTMGLAANLLGAEATTPARSAFLTALSVIFVPAYEYLATRRRPRRQLALAAALAVAGVYLFFHPVSLEWRRGDSLTLLGALIFAFYIVELGKRSRRHDTLALVFAQFITIAVMAAPLALLVGTPQFQPGWRIFGELVYLGLVCSALTFVIMTWAQARVSPMEAAVIYTLEPVFAAAFSIALGREVITMKALLGGSVIIIAMILASADPGETHTVAPPEGID